MNGRKCYTCYTSENKGVTKGVTKKGSKYAAYGALLHLLHLFLKYTPIYRNCAILHENHVTDVKF